MAKWDQRFMLESLIFNRHGLDDPTIMGLQIIMLYYKTYAQDIKKCLLISNNLSPIA